MDTFETVVRIDAPWADEVWYGEDSGFTYEKESDGKWWVDTNDDERGPFSTFEQATECMAYAFGW